MRLRPLRKLILVLLAMVVVVGGAAGYFFVQLTARPVIELRQDPNSVEAREAVRKVKLFEDAQKGKKKGYIRLSEVEINSYLEETVFTKNIETNGVVLLDGKLLLESDGMVWVSWVQMPFFGFELPLVWQRQIDLVQKEDGWGLELRGMQLGQMRIPPDQWERVEELLGQVDALFQEQFGWALKAPTVEIAKNDLSKAPELRLYTFVPEKNETK